MQIYYCIPATTIFQDEAAYCLQDTFKLTKAILKCQLDIFEQIGSILTELQEQAREMGMRVMGFDFWNENLILRIIWDEGISIGKEEDRPFLSGLSDKRD